MRKVKEYKYKRLEEIMTIDTLHSIIEYNPITGKLYWRERTYDMISILNMTKAGIHSFNSRFAGKELSNKPGNNGYLMVGMMLNGAKITELQHRVAWALFHNKWAATDQVTVLDHINRDKTDNRIINLREVSNTDNHYNVDVRANNTSSKTGVSYKKDKKMWQAYYFFQEKQYHLGYFKDFEEAVAKREEWEESYKIHSLDRTSSTVIH
jgi:hypothetical protein